ncbi:hypothetical protein [Micromonospora sp. WMMD1274]|uniref:hypothetical protein n=1 Tax=Micromonospora sp. WMMD1274 TaxID=3404116 RepID=UPI003B95301D
MEQVQTRRTPQQRLVPALAGIALLIPVAGCGNSTVPVREPSSPGVTVATSPANPPAGSAADPSHGERVEVDGRIVLGVAPGLGFPSGSKVDTAFGAPGAATVILTAPPPEQALSHYRKAGPTSGYPVRTDTGETLHLVGRGWVVTVIATSRDTTITFAHDQPAETSAAPPPEEGTALTGRDLGVTNLPFNFRFPPGSRLRDLSDSKTGARFTLVAPAPERVLAFYRAYLPTGFFEVTADRTVGGITTITFDKDDGEWTGTIEATSERVTVTTARHR